MPTSTRQHPRNTLIGLVMACLSLPASLAAARDVMIVGTPHPSGLQPRASPEHLGQAVAALASYRPTAVCIEADDAEQIQSALQDLPRYGGMLAQFAAPQMAMAPLQQAGLGLPAPAAREQAAALLRRTALDADEQLRLIQLQLATYDVWSAVLNWSGLADKAGARKQLGASTTDTLERLATSQNEIATLAIPLARGNGLRSLCAVDAMGEETWVGELVQTPGMLQAMSDPDLHAGIERMNALQGEQWQPRAGAGALRQFLGWINSDAFARLDLATQWDVFDDPRWRADGQRRLMFWHARNAAIASRLMREAGKPTGERVLLVIGAAHRPFLEEDLRARRWVRVVPATGYLTADDLR